MTQFLSEADLIPPDAPPAVPPPLPGNTGKLPAAPGTHGKNGEAVPDATADTKADTKAETKKDGTDGVS